MLNVAVLMGRLVADPELRHTPNNVSVTSFTIAVDRSYVKSGADRQTDFIDIVAWRNTAEFVCRYFSKGSMIAIQGSIQTRSYNDKDGNKRKAFEIIADSVNFADSKRNADSSSSSSYANNDYGHSQMPETTAYSNGSNNDFEELPIDDDLPF